MNGTKQFITNATDAHVAIIMAMTDPSLGRKGISSFIVEKDTPGYSVSKVEKKLGMRGSPTASLTFDNCKIPKANIIGEVGEGYKQALTTLEGGRISIGSLALGIAQAAFDSALAYAKQRESFGQPIGKHQFIQGLPCRHGNANSCSSTDDLSRCLDERPRQARNHGRLASKTFSPPKLPADAATSAFKSMADMATSKISRQERYLRDAKLCEIGEGTSEIQRLVIARTARTLIARLICSTKPARFKTSKFQNLQCSKVRIAVHINTQ